MQVIRHWLLKTGYGFSPVVVCGLKNDATAGHSVRILVFVVTHPPLLYTLLSPRTVALSVTTKVRCFNFSKSQIRSDVAIQLLL